MGYVGQPTHPEVVKVIESTLGQIAEAGRVAGTMVVEGYLDRYVAAGARFLHVSFDGWLAAGARQYLAQLAELGS